MLVRTPEGDSTALHLLPRSVRQRGEVVWKAQAKKNVISQFHQVAPPAACTAPPPAASSCRTRLVTPTTRPEEWVSAPSPAVPTLRRTASTQLCLDKASAHLCLSNTAGFVGRKYQ